MRKKKNIYIYIYTHTYTYVLFLVARVEYGECFSNFSDASDAAGLLTQ